MRISLDISRTNGEIDESLNKITNNRLASIENLLFMMSYALVPMDEKLDIIINNTNKSDCNGTDMEKINDIYLRCNKNIDEIGVRYHSFRNYSENNSTEYERLMAEQSYLSNRGLIVSGIMILLNLILLYLGYRSQRKPKEN